MGLICLFFIISFKENKSKPTFIINYVKKNKSDKMSEIKLSVESGSFFILHGYSEL